MRVVIVGAGPIGCYTAQLLKRQGIEPLLLEEHKELGRPVHCAGVVGREVYKDSRLPLSKECIRTRIDGAQIYYGGESFSLTRKAVAYIIDREMFDKDLGKGLDVRYETKFLGFEKIKKAYLVETDKGDFQADMIIGADGAVSRVREAAGLAGDVRYFSGVQFRIAAKTDNGNFVRVYIKKPFFSWIVPEDNGCVRTGIISDNPFNDLKKFLQEIRLDGEIIDKFGGIIPVGTCQIAKDNIALVGDAACQVKPLTHGGIFYGMRGAEILVDCIARHRLTEYDKLWKKRYGNEIRLALYFKNMYERLSEKDLGAVFGLLQASAERIEKTGDFENHSSVIIEILKDKNVQNRLGSVLWNMLKSICERRDV